MADCAKDDKLKKGVRRGARPPPDSRGSGSRNGGNRPDDMSSDRWSTTAQYGRSGWSLRNGGNRPDDISSERWSTTAQYGGFGWNPRKGSEFGWNPRKGSECSPRNGWNRPDDISSERWSTTAQYGGSGWSPRNGWNRPDDISSERWSTTAQDGRSELAQRLSELGVKATRLPELLGTAQRLPRSMSYLNGKEGLSRVARPPPDSRGSGRRNGGNRPDDISSERWSTTAQDGRSELAQRLSELGGKAPRLPEFLGQGGSLDPPKFGIPPWK